MLTDLCAFVRNCSGCTKERIMGNSQSVKSDSPPPVELPRSHNIRASIRTNKLPMPDLYELERRFTKVLVSPPTWLWLAP